MDAQVNRSKAETALAQQFADALARLPGNAEVKRLRETSFARFETSGLPTRRVEEWKYTNLRTLMPEAAPLAPAPGADALKRAKAIVAAHAISGARPLVLVDGVFVPSLSDVGNLDNGLVIHSLEAFLLDSEKPEILSPVSVSDPLISLNSAFMTGGVAVAVDDGVQIDRPIHIVHVSTTASPSAMFTRSLFKLGAGATATLVESFAGAAAAYQVNDLVQVWVGDGATFEHVRLMQDGAEAINVSTLLAEVGAKARFNTFNLTSGGAVSRYQGFIKCAGQNTSVATNGVNLLRGEQHGDTTLFMDHAVPHCMSREVFRSVLDDSGHSVFQGRILVRADAQKTDAKMMARALLLSDDAEVDVKPELEIFADDVTCGHGATAGALDESLLFYLRARGLPEKQAQALLIQAFVGEAIESIVNDGLRDAVIAASVRWLEARE